MSDEPSLTRWSFQDFEFYYDAKFGTRRGPKPEEKGVATGTRSGGNLGENEASSSGNGVRMPELAIYEQFRIQLGNVASPNGGISNGPHDILQKPLLPPFEDAEMRNLAESLLRDIVRGNPDVKWASIKGLENAKHLLKEAVVMPIKFPK